MKKPTHPDPFMGKILRKLAPRIDARIMMDPEWNMVGQICFANGKKRYFRKSSLDLNTVGASEIGKDKDHANFFMQKMGYPVIPGKTFFSPEWGKAIGSTRGIDAAYQYACTQGFPVIVKPNSGSQGHAVALVHTRRDFYSAVRRIFKIDRIALVQKPVQGKDYRILVLDDHVVLAYERIPLNVVGNGRSSIRMLFESKKKSLAAAGRETEVSVDDPRIKMKLVRTARTLESVPARGERVYLLDNANLSAGGDAVDVTNDINLAFRALAVKLTKDMGLRFCGVDLMVEGDITQKPKNYWVLEINALPGLTHYAKTSKKHEKIVEDVYLEVLKHIERS